MSVLLSEEFDEAGLSDTPAKETGPLCTCLLLRAALPVLAETVALVSAV